MSPSWFLFLLYLPPYSPDLNPIEKLFAKRKALLRKAATRTTATLWDEFGQLLAGFSPTECANYFASPGYVYTEIENVLMCYTAPSSFP